MKDTRHVRQHLLIFDGTCGICERLVRWVQTRDKAGRIQALPNQTPGLIERYGLTRVQVDREVWVVDVEGRVLGGAAAVNRVFEALGGLWWWLGRILRLPPLFWCEERAYHWVAAHRHLFGRWGVAPVCERARGNITPRREERKGEERGTD